MESFQVLEILLRLFKSAVTIITFIIVIIMVVVIFFTFLQFCLVFARILFRRCPIHVIRIMYK